MTELVFVDTNVLVYARDSSEGTKQKRAVEWLMALWKSRRARLSYQVLREYYVTVTRKLKPGMKVALARNDVRSLSLWRPVSTNQRLLDGAWSIEDRFGLSFWDSLIVSAARLGGCRYLLTEDLQAGQSFDSVEVVNPFEVPPESLLS